MIDNTITDKNKLIAEFMGFEYVPYAEGQTQSPGWWNSKCPNIIKGKMPSATKLSEDYFLCRRHGELRYFNNWNWLMSVIEKIEKLDLSDWYDEGNFMNIDVSIDTGHCYIFVQLNYDPPHRVCGESNYKMPKIKLVYLN